MRLRPVNTAACRAPLGAIRHSLRFVSQISLQRWRNLRQKLLNEEQA